MVNRQTSGTIEIQFYNLDEKFLTPHKDIVANLFIMLEKFKLIKKINRIILGKYRLLILFEDK